MGGELVRKPILYLLAALVVIVDQATKAWISGHFSEEETRDILPGFFALTLVHNTGGAFGILPHGASGLAFAAIAAIGGIVYFTIRAPAMLPLSLAWALGLPLGGALGNLSDRLRLTYVVDFLDVHVADHHWPVFNVADAAICVGVALLAIRCWGPSPAPKKADVAPAITEEARIARE
jgi:signal peptidase II